MLRRAAAGLEVGAPEHARRPLPAAQVIHDCVVGDLIWHLRLFPGSRECRRRRAEPDISRDLLLECFQHKLLERIGLLSADPFIGGMGELLGLETDTSVKLHFETLAGVRLDPRAVDAFVLIIGPGILEFVQLETFAFQAFDVRPDTLSVASLPILKGVPDRVRYNRYSLFWGKLELLDLS